MYVRLYGPKSNSVTIDLDIDELTSFLPDQTQTGRFTIRSTTKTISKQSSTWVENRKRKNFALFISTKKNIKQRSNNFIVIQRLTMVFCMDKQNWILISKDHRRNLLDTSARCRMLTLAVHEFPRKHQKYVPDSV